jgi:hypothetical protein
MNHVRGSDWLVETVGCHAHATVSHFLVGPSTDRLDSITPVVHPSTKARPYRPAVPTSEFPTPTRVLAQRADIFAESGQVARCKERVSRIIGRPLNQQPCGVS